MNHENTLKVIIVGAGFSGICMGIQLRLNGIEDFIIIEKGQQVGGTWWDNKYPGAECDVESHLYSFSFEPNPNWSRVYSGSDEIHQYLIYCAEKHGLYNHIRFEETALEAHFHSNGEWTLTTSKQKYRARFLVFSSSPLHYPSYPLIYGLDSFSGKIMHTSNWDSSYPLQGKKIAMIGCGASGIQVAPHLQRVASHLTIFQRTPQWIGPKGNRSFTSLEKTLFRTFPILMLIYRTILYYYHEFLFNSFYKQSKLGRFLSYLCLTYLHFTVADRDLRRRLTPRYTFGCKRVLMSDDFYQCLNYDNVTMITDPIDSVTSDSIVSKGVNYQADVIILATGFNITGGINSVKMYDEKGEQIDTTDVTHQVFGVYLPNVKNFFTLVGYTSLSNHTSVIVFIESQVQHILRVMKHVFREEKKSVVIRQEYYDSFGRELKEKNQHLIFLRCKNWYVRGEANVAVYPDSFEHFRQSLLKMNLEENLHFQ